MYIHTFLFIISGGIAGWIANTLIGNKNAGVFGSIVLGVIGAFVGKLVFGLFGVAPDNPINVMTIATGGAMMVVLMMRATAK